MKIALVTLDYPPEKGGVASYLGNLVKASDGKMDVFVNETHEAVGPGHVRPVRMLRGGWPQWWPMVRLIRSLKGKGYDGVLVSHLLPVGTAAWLARLTGGLPYLVLVHGLDLRMATVSRRKRWLARRVLKAAKMIMVSSEFVGREVAEFVGAHGNAPRAHNRVPLQILTPGVEALVFPSRENARQELGIAADAKIILSVSRLVIRKGIDQLIRALAFLEPAARLVIVGDGADRKRLEELAQTDRERILFVPHANDAERNRWYAAADVFALPVREEAGDVEGFGIVYLEAALAGLPVLAGKSGGATEAVIDNVTGILVDSKEVKEVASGLKLLLDDPELRRQLGQRGRERALRDFRWEDRWKKILHA